MNVNFKESPSRVIFVWFCLSVIVASNTAWLYYDIDIQAATRVEVSYTLATTALYAGDQ